MGRNFLEDDPNEMVQSIGQSKFFFDTVLRILEKKSGNQSVVSYLKLKAFFDLPQLSPKNKITISEVINDN